MAHRSYVSPDRTRVLIVEMDDKGMWLPCRLLPIDGGASLVAGPSNGRCTDAAWSPDGRAVVGRPVMAEDVARNGFWALYLIPLDGGAPRRLTGSKAPDIDMAPAFSPEGRSLAYAACTKLTRRVCDINVVDLDSGYAPTAPPRRASVHLSNVRRRPSVGGSGGWGTCAAGSALRQVAQLCRHRLRHLLQSVRRPARSQSNERFPSDLAPRVADPDSGARFFDRADARSGTSRTTVRFGASRRLARRLDDTGPPQHCGRRFDGDREFSLGLQFTSSSVASPDR